MTGFKASNGNQESVKLDVTTVNLDLSGTSVDPCNGNTCPVSANSEFWYLAASPA